LKDNNLLLKIKSSFRYLSIVLIIIALFISFENVSSKNIAKSKYNPKNRKEIVVTKKSKTSSKKSKQPIKKSNKTAKKNSVTNQQKQLDELYKSINKTRSEIDKISQKEKTTQKTVQKYQKHIEEVNRYLRLLTIEIDELQDSIIYLGKEINKAGRNKAGVKNDFAKAASQKYLKDIAKPEESFIFNQPAENDIQDDIYIKWFAERSSSKYNQISNYMDSTQDLVKILYEKTLREESLKNLKIATKNQLGKTIAEQQSILTSLQKDKKTLDKKLRQMESSAKTMKGIIANLIKKEALEKAKPKNVEKPGKPEKGTKKQKEEIPKVASAGSLSWPTKGHSILRRFGQYSNPGSKTVFDNPGIDIGVPQGTPVTAAAAGTVSLLHWLPGYGSLIIINHNNGLRTVYANLNIVHVKKGESIKAGEIIGKSGGSSDGDFLHFEVWNGSNRLNPMKYLK
jgi:septal ring factor EnvC (AmiA/AmiB activator)